MNVCNYSAPGEYIEVAKHQCSSSFILKMEFILVHFQQHLSPSGTTHVNKHGAYSMHCKLAVQVGSVTPLSGSILSVA